MEMLQVMIPQLAAALAPQQYDELPVCIKDQFSVKEWLWLSDTEKARLIANETEPEYFHE
jgi:hypothetical protein